VTPVRIASVAGSLRAGSFNRALLRAAVELAPEGVEWIPLEIRDLPLYDGDVEARGLPPAVRAFRDGLAAADAVLIATPEYNHSIPGGLKNAIDWASRGKDQPFRDRLVGMMGASNGRIGTARSQMALLLVLSTLNARVLNRPEVLVANAPEKFDAALRLVDEPTRAHVRALVEALVAAVRAGAPAPGL
jgi:chromate reductase